MAYRLNTIFCAFDRAHGKGEFATYPLARLVTRLPLSLVVAGNGLLPPHFAAVTCPDAPSGASNPDS
jgi:hypothetical protein